MEKKNVIKETKVSKSLSSVSDRQPLGAHCDGSFSEWPCSKGSDGLAPSIGLPVCEEERSLQNCLRDTWACQGCSAGVAVTRQAHAS